MNRELIGIDQIEGTYPFDVRQSVKAYRLNRFLWNLAKATHRERFHADEPAACLEAGLSDEEIALIRNRDFLGLIRYGACFFVLEKFARTLKISNFEMYAQMRNESLEAYMRTRKVPAAR
jgi:protocatechuate 4,5-dioxygenase alpha subunit